MYECMYVCVYVCTHVCMYVVCMHSYTCMGCMHVCMTCHMCVMPYERMQHLGSRPYAILVVEYVVRQLLH